MTIRKKEAETNDQTENEGPIPAGVSKEEAKVAKEASIAVKDDEVGVAVDDEDDDGLKEPPEGVTVVNAEASLAIGFYVDGMPSHGMDDEYVSKAGSYAISAEDGIRRPVYEKFLNAKGKDRYRPVP